MKKLLYLFFIVVLAGTLNAQTNNVLIEVCTGVWCGYCPCGDAVAETILQSYPNALVLAYHASSSSYTDPYASFNGSSIKSLLGFNAAPTAIIGRKSGIINRDSWYSEASSQSTNYTSPLTLSFNKVIDSTARTVNLTVTATALRDIDTNVYINFVITENNIISQQYYYATCGTTGWHYDFVHNWIVRNMVNGATGEVLSTGHWAAGTTKSVSWTTTIAASWVWYNCVASAFAYFNTGSISSTGSCVLQTKKTPVNTVTTGVGTPSVTIPSGYELSQNYPNPFNPVTNIHFSIPKESNVSLKVYDILGNEITTFYNGYLKAGYYNAEFDGSKLSSGLYFYRLTAGSFTDTKKMILTK